MFFTLIRFYSPMIAKLYLLPATSRRIRFSWPHISVSDALFSVRRNWLRCTFDRSSLIAATLIGLICPCCGTFRSGERILQEWPSSFPRVWGVSQSVRFPLSPGLICAKSTIPISIRSTILAFCSLDHGDSSSEIFTCLPVFSVPFWDFSVRAKPYWTNYFTLWPAYYSVVYHPKRYQKAHGAVYRESFLKSRT